jgi:peptide/nickel transport system ATP-binding protein
MATSTQEPSQVRETSGITIQNLRIVLTARPGVDVVDDIDLVMRPGEVVGLVGESGSGKTTVGTALLGYTRPGASIDGGEVVFEGKDVLNLPWQQVRSLRGEEIAYVPQDPAAALNPSIRIGKQIVELLELRGIGTAESRLQGARDGLAEVGLPNDDEFLRRYSHQLSGGQVQRVALAMAFLPKPKVLVLDEPTTGLDAVARRSVWSAVRRRRDENGATVVLVTHNVLEAESVLDRVAVLDAGRVIACDTPARLKAAVDDSVRVQLVWRREPPLDDAGVMALARGATVDGRRWTSRLDRAEARDVLARLSRPPLLDALDDFTVSTPTLEDVYLAMGGRSDDLERG